MKILLVEDQKDLREILEKRLKKEYSVDSCEDGEEALDFLSVYSYDIVLLDIMLPKLDGMEVLRRMRPEGDGYAGAASDSEKRYQRPGTGTGQRSG